MLHIVCAEDHLRFVKVGSRGTWELLRVDGLEAFPLYFHVTPSALITGSFARERFDAGDQAVQAFFWARIADATQVVERYGVLVRLVNLLDDVMLRAREAYGLRETQGGPERLAARITFAPGISEAAKTAFRSYVAEKGLQLGEDSEYFTSLAAGMVASGSIPDGATAVLLDVAFGDVQLAITTCTATPALLHTASLAGLGSDKRIGLLSELLVEKAASALSMPVLWNDPDNRRREVAHVRPQAQRLLDRFEYGELRARVELTIHAHAQVVVREEELRTRDSAWAARLEQQLEQAIGARAPDWAEVLHPVLWTESLQRFLARKVSSERVRGPRTNTVDLVLRGTHGSESAIELARREQEHLAQERAERERTKAEQEATAQAAREQVAKEQLEKERLERERLEEKQRQAKAQATKERAELERKSKEQVPKKKRPVPPPPPPPPLQNTRLKVTETVSAVMAAPLPPGPPPPPASLENTDAASEASAEADPPKSKLDLLPRKRTPRWPLAAAIMAIVLWLIGNDTGGDGKAITVDTAASVAQEPSDSVPDPLVPVTFIAADRVSNPSGELSVGAHDRYRYSLLANHEYVFTAQCEQACIDLNLVLEDEAGLTLESDRRPSRTAELIHRPSESLSTTLDVRMIGCSKFACRYKVHVYARSSIQGDSALLDESVDVDRARALIGELISSSQFLFAYAFIDSVPGLSVSIKDGERERIITACEEGNRRRRQVMLSPFPCPQGDASLRQFAFDDTARTVLGRATQLSGTGEGFEIISELRRLSQSEQVSASLRERLLLAALDLAKQCRGAQSLDSSIICP